MNDDQTPHLPEEPEQETLPEALADYLNLIDQTVDRDVTDQDIEAGLQQLLAGLGPDDGGDQQPSTQELADSRRRAFEEVCVSPPFFEALTLETDADDLVLELKRRSFTSLWRKSQRGKDPLVTLGTLEAARHMIYAEALAEAHRAVDSLMAEARADAERIVEKAQRQAALITDEARRREADAETVVCQAEEIFHRARREAREIIDAARRDADQCQDDALQEAIYIVDKAHQKADQILDTARETSDIVVETARQTANSAITNALTEARRIRESTEAAIFAPPREITSGPRPPRAFAMKARFDCDHDHRTWSIVQAKYHQDREKAQADSADQHKSDELWEEIEQANDSRIKADFFYTPSDTIRGLVSLLSAGAVRDPVICYFNSFFVEAMEYSSHQDPTSAPHHAGLILVSDAKQDSEAAAQWTSAAQIERAHRAVKILFSSSDSLPEKEDAHEPALLQTAQPATIDPRP